MRCPLKMPRPVYCVLFSSIAGLSVQAVPPDSIIRQLDRRALPEATAGLMGIEPTSAMVAAGPFPSSGISLLSQVSVSQLRGALNASATNDIWGYVSPSSGREYAIVGLNVGTAFVEVTDPLNPVVVATLSDASSIWSDMKTYDTYAYNVNESGGGMQVIALGGIDSGTVSLLTPLTSGLQTSHNLALNEDSGYAYLCGSNLGGLVAVDLSNPRVPVLAGQWVGPYVHDAQIVTYTEGIYAGREIAFCFCGSSGLYIADVTDKNNMFTLGSLQYPNVTYCHQGWLSEDRQTVYVDDELDELQNPNVNTTTTYVVDVQDLSDPQFVTSYTNGLTTIDHNLFVRGDYIFLANYTSGLRVYDASDRNNLHEIGYFDTYPASNSKSFNGAWGNYPYLPSGVVLVSDQSNGLFVLDVSAIVPSACNGPNAPAALASPVEKNRYVSFKPLNAGRQVALSVTFTDLPPDLAALEGATMWVDTPTTVSLANGSLDVARLRCDPLYRDWGDVDVLHLYGHEIIPNVTYLLQANQELDCGEGLQLMTSAELSCHTVTEWGDITGGSPSGPNGMTDFSDISALVASFQGSINAPSITQTDLAPGIPDQVANFIDINACVGAFQDAGYPYSGPAVCQ